MNLRRLIPSIGFLAVVILAVTLFVALISRLTREIGGPPDPIAIMDPHLHINKSFTQDELDRIRGAAQDRYKDNHISIETKGRIVTVTIRAGNSVKIDGARFVSALTTNIPAIYQQAEMDQLNIVLTQDVQDKSGQLLTVPCVTVNIPAVLYKAVNWDEVTMKQFAQLLNTGADQSLIQYSFGATQARSD